MNLIKQKRLFNIFVAVIFMAAFFVLSAGVIFASEAIDTDGDGLSDVDEITLYHTDPDNPDTDGDGYNDHTEIYNGYSPRHAEPIKLSSLDSDSDGIPDSWEIRLAMNLLNVDTDNDGYDDETEIIHGYNPKSAEPEKLEKLIKVNLEQQKLAYYFNNTELEEFAVSGGLASMPTPIGEFTVMDKVPSKSYGGNGFDFYYPDTRWNLHFTTDYWKYYIHGAYWHNNFGQPMSHGCVNVRYAQMERLYNFAEIGTRVEIS